MARSPSPSSTSRRRRSRSPRRREHRHETRRRSASSSSSSSSGSGSDPRRRRKRDGDHDTARRKERRKRPEGVGKVEADEVEKGRGTRRAFERWVWRTKGKEVDRLEPKKVKRYAAKFAKAWNRGRLDRQDYPPPTTEASSEPVPGPSLADVHFSRAEAQDSLASSRLASRAAARRERREAREEEAAERATGRDRLVEKRRERNEERRGYQRERDEAGLEVDEATLMGGGGAKSSFAAAVAARDRARERWQAKRLGADKEERDAVAREAKQRVRQKEDDTMAMFKAMAASRYGSHASS